MRVCVCVCVCVCTCVSHLSVHVGVNVHLRVCVCVCVCMCVCVCVCVCVCEHGVSPLLLRVLDHHGAELVHEEDPGQALVPQPRRALTVLRHRVLIRGQNLQHTQRREQEHMSELTHA